MVFPINPDSTEVFTVEANVSRQYKVHEDGEVSGSLKVIPLQLKGLKEIYNTEKMISPTYFGEININEKLEEIKKDIFYFGRKEALEAYMQDVHASSDIGKYQTTASIFAFRMPPNDNKNMQRRLLIQRLQEKNPIMYGQESSWSTTNYHSVNFFTSSNTPVSSALIYPNKLVYNAPFGEVETGFSHLVINPTLSFDTTGTGSYKSSYQLHGPFTFEFFIKPSYNADAELLWAAGTSSYYRPGCIMHYSSSYAITLHSGSSKNQNELVDKFRLCFQFGTHTNTPPDQLLYGQDVSGSLTGSVFWSSDNSLNYNEWNHVVLTYGGVDFEQGTGSLYINKQKDRDVPIGPLLPVATWSLDTGTGPGRFWGALFVGNYYQGVQQAGQRFVGPSSDVEISRFWGTLTSGPFFGQGPGDWESYISYQFNSLNRRNKTNNLGERIYSPNKNYFILPSVAIGSFISSYASNASSGPPPWGYPLTHSFAYPLNAELHDVRLWDKHFNIKEVEKLYSGDLIEENLNHLMFWLPPFYVENSVQRFNEPLNPFYSFSSPGGNLVSSSFPFAARMAMSVNGYYPNLENYLIDIATDNIPVLWNLRWFPNETVSSIADLTADQWMYETLQTSSAIRKRLYTILPCDDGNYKPSFNLIEKLDYHTESFHNQFGAKTLGRINLQDSLYYNDNDLNTSAVGIASFVAQNAILASNESLTSSILNDIFGARPEDPTENPGTGFAIWHRTRTSDSHFVTMLDISNIFYGERIKPGSFELTVNGLSGSSGAIPMTILDNGRGGLYRASAASEAPLWSTVGSIDYDNGIVVIKYPQLTFITENGWEVKFQGVRDVHVYSIEATLYPQTCTESTDPNFTVIETENDPYQNPNEIDKNPVMVGSVLIHDENLNVIMRTNLAQSIVKKSGDKLLFRIKMDY